MSESVTSEHIILDSGSRNIGEQVAMLQPLHDLVIIGQDEAAASIGRILLPDTVKEKPRRGLVMAVGDGYRDRDSGRVIPCAVKPGDRVIFGAYAGTSFNYEGKDYLYMRESDLIAIVPVTAEQLAEFEKQKAEAPVVPIAPSTEQRAAASGIELATS